MDSITFKVVGTPSPKGSLTRMPNGAMIPAGTVESRKRFTDWRNDCRRAAIEAMDELTPVRVSIRLMVEFRLPYPVSSMRKYQMGWLPHTKKPDVDKLLRALMDSLTGIVWVDDAQVSFVTVNKSYAWNGQPCAYVVVDFLTESALREIAEASTHIVDVLESL